MFGKLKKKLIAGVGALALACVALGGLLVDGGKDSGNRVINVSADEVAVNIESNNLSYSDSTFILYAVSNAGFDRSQFPISMLFWNEPQADYAKGSEDYSTVSRKTVTLGQKDCLVFYSQGFAAKNIVDTVYARACVEIGGEIFYSDVKKFGVIEYVYTMREGGDLNDEQVEMMDTMLEYGTVAQKLFDYKTESLANQPFYKLFVKNGAFDDGFDWGRYALNEKVTLTANPAPEGYKFSHWVNAAEENIGTEESMTVTVDGANVYTAVYKLATAPAVTVADFKTMNGGKNSSTYSTQLNSTNGWTGVGAIQFGTTDAYSFLGANDTAVVLNGRTTSIGWLQSPTISGGFAGLRLQYGIPFSDTKFSLVFEITDENGNVTTQTIEKTGLSKGNSGVITIDVPTQIQGNVTIKITNGCLSNVSNSHKDRVAIYNLTVYGFGTDMNEISGGGSGTGSGGGSGTGSATLDVHFLELGNYYTGDSTFIKAGDVDILIDAGSRASSASTISNYINQYCTDGVLEYVVATHAHQDHIAGFVGSNNDGIFDLYRVGTLIDFARTDATTAVYNNYVTKRSALIAKGTKHYTALDWWNEEGLSRTIELAEGISMTVLYQEYYEKQTSKENNYSVCLMLSQGDNHYLFTGDLETAGEESLVKNNSLPKMKVYKAGHHGSKTSSSATLLSVIRPEIVCICCCCGSDEYTDIVESQYPMQVVVDRLAVYTEQIYITSLAVNDASGDTVGVTSMNGNIVVSASNAGVSVNCSNNNTIFKDTEWFKKNRTWPSGS